MHLLLNKLSSPRNLVVFESAARLGSFTRAAEELNMRQPSVSAAIKQLEESLSVRLFYREHRKVGLTLSGERLFAGVSRSLAEIERSIAAVQEMARTRHVTVNSSSAFSLYWMIPRLQALHEKHPDIDLRMQTSDYEPDLDVEGVDLGIRRGNGSWPDCHSVLIAKEIIFPVANPQVFHRINDLNHISDLLRQRLVHLEEPKRERPTWAQWFDHNGQATQELDKGLRLNDYALVIQAALAGEGFAFGWEHVVRDLIERKLLVGRKDWAWETGNGFYLTWSNRSPLSRHGELVRDWIISVSDFPALKLP